MNRSKIESTLSSYQSGFSSFVRQNPERAFFLGIIMGFLFFLLKGLLIPMFVAAIGLAAVLWVLGDGLAEEQVSVEEIVDEISNDSLVSNQSSSLDDKAEEIAVSPTYTPKKPSVRRVKSSATKDKPKAEKAKATKRQSPASATKKKTTSKTKKAASKKTPVKKEAVKKATKKVVKKKAAVKKTTIKTAVKSKKAASSKKVVKKGPSKRAKAKPTAAAKKATRSRAASR